MSGLRAAITGLGTGVAARTFLTFALCAVVPIALFAGIAHRVVSSELREVSAERLSHTSKSYGLLIFERVRQSEELLSRLAEAHLNGQMSIAALRAFESRRLRITDVRADGPDDAAGSDARLLVVRERERAPYVAVRVLLVRDEKRIALTGAIASDYLWNADAISLPGAYLCVRDETGPLHCVGEAHAGPTMAGEWSLFLRASYGAEAWTVETRQASDTAFATLHTFRRTLPIIAGVAIGLALLLSAMQIRRSHGPLAVLAEAAARISERRTARPVVLDAHDEYGRLGLAFNQMATSVARQFAMMGALARIDRMILANPSIGAVLERTLPELPRLMRARAAAVLVQPDDRNDAQLYVAYRDHPERVRLRRMTLSDEELRALLHEDAAASNERLRALRAELFAASKSTAFEAAPIRVERRLRGALLLGHASEGAHPERRRFARAFARRFAVALGAEERRQALLRQAYYDDLTGLPNRQLFKDRLQQELAHARRAGESVALLYIDLDRFKNINDSLGHTAGDDLLRLAGARIRSVVRETDTLARLGGDEFIVIASATGGAPAHVLAERLQAALSSPATIREVTCCIEASIGIAVYPQDGATAELLLRNADTAMYRAKAAGGGRAVYFEEKMNREATRRLHMEQRLRAALAQGALTLAYQPKIRTHDGAIEGVEALARWRDEELGNVSPAEFIPVAEECGLIDDLGEWAMHEACTAYQQWLAQGVDVGHVSVNVSLRQLRDQQFLQCVRRVLLETRISPDALELEVTESTVAERPQQVMALVDELRALGVRIAIDDFGVGYSSMAALGHLPADVLKIDRSLVEHCAMRPESASIVEAVISMAHALGKLTVAEGVETEEQLALLRTLGCDAVQGYLYSKPLPASEIAGFASAHLPCARDATSGPACSPPETATSRRLYPG